jgi:4-amino-4-deoxy-L-arabinose transferase-like glycosyltransferase
MLLVQPRAMIITASPEPATLPHGSSTLRSHRVPALLCGLWLVLFFASLFSPPVLDDADGTHANAARQMMLSGDWVTLRVNNVRYLEKAPLPYWIAAASFRVFGLNAFAAHLPQALAVLLLMLLGVRWAREAFGDRAALYTGLGILTSAGVFLFTRILLPDPLLSLLLAAGLYCFLRSLEPAPTPGASQLDSEMWDAAPQTGALRRSPLYPYALWTALALAVLTKGLVALVFLFATAALYLALTGEHRHWRRLKPVSGVLLMLVIAAPWHILAGLRNTGGMDGHGFFWFYFVNEHVLRFLGRRIPMDYNKLPGSLYWSLHLVWLFPWALFAPLGIAQLFRRWRSRRTHFAGRSAFPLQHLAPAQRTTLLLSLFSAVVLLFFSLSTNQEYYTFPAYLPLLMLLAAALTRAESNSYGDTADAISSRRWIAFAHAAFTTIGLAVAAALAYGLWTSRHLAFVPDIGDLLAHRGIGDYTLSMSSLFDLTGPSFAALRLPAALALAAFAIGPAVAWMLRAHRRHIAATATLALTSAAFLIAAHIALVRFAPMLSSEDMAARIQQLEASGAISPNNTLLLYGDQSFGSSIPFYLNRPLDRPALLVEGRSSSMLFGSTFPDAQQLFLTPSQLLAQWGHGERKLLFVPLARRDEVNRLLGPHQTLLAETSGKALITDRPLNDRPLDH